jgi:hypothetical protein
MAVYEGNWENYEDLKRDYPDVPAEETIIYAEYETPDYEGFATVVFKENGKLYVNHDAHCSCNGLQGWDPEETTVEALKMYKNYCCSSEKLNKAVEDTAC